MESVDLALEDIGVILQFHYFESYVYDPDYGTDRQRSGMTRHLKKVNSRLSSVKTEQST